MFQSQGKYDEAEQIQRQTLDLRMKVSRKERPGTVTSMNNLAVVLRSQGKYEEAGRIHREEPQLKEGDGQGTSHTLTRMNKLAVVLDSQGSTKRPSEYIDKQSS